MKPVALFFFLCLGCSKSFVAGQASPTGDQTYSVGILRSKISTPDKLSEAIANATFRYTSSGRCTVEAKLWSMSAHDDQTTEQFPYPIFMEMVYSLSVSYGATICGSVPDNECSPGKTVYYCTTDEQQAAGIQEAIQNNWLGNPAYTVKKLSIDPVGGVRVGN